MRFVERGIVEQREENIRGRMMQQRSKLLAGGDTRAFAIFRGTFGRDRFGCNGFGHKLTFGDLQRARQGIAGK